jgi:hypothetical protein
LHLKKLNLENSLKALELALKKTEGVGLGDALGVGDVLGVGDGVGEGEGDGEVYAFRVILNSPPVIVFPPSFSVCMLDG